MTQGPPAEGRHDWHSAAYVESWISGDVTRDDQRRPHLQAMLTGSGLAHDTSLRVLDVGAGYGLFAGEVLRSFPASHVTLQDYSEAMLAQAAERLVGFSARTAYVIADLSTSGWTSALDGGFDLAVSALVIHNLHGEGRVAPIYADITSVLAPGGLFLDYDLVSFTGGLGRHLGWLSEAGLVGVTGTMVDATAAVLTGRRPA